ncbi:MAG: hypothetical protein ACP5NW_03685 [Candidatus Woesearchaeota archaeon]
MKQFKHIASKGQVWTVDFLLGLMLFIIVVLSSAKIIWDVYPQSKNVDVYHDAVYLSDTLLSEGYPLDWTETNVILPGVGGNNRINETKLSSLDDLDYNRLKTLLHTTSDFIFFIRNSTDILNISGCTHGYNLTTDATCNPNLSSITYSDLAKIDRMIIYNSTVMILTLYAWN